MPAGATDLVGRHAVVTGGAGALGAQITRGFLDAGMTVVVADRELVDVAPGAVGIRCDVAQRDDVRRLGEEVLERFGRTDVLVTCAGTFVLEHVLCTEPEAWDAMVGANLTGTLLCLQTFGPAMVAAGGGSIVTLGSQLGRVALTGHAAYSATKAGVEMLTRAAAHDLGGTGVRVNCLIPGPVATEGTREILESPEMAVRMRPRTLLGRHLVPADLVGPALFLASSQSGGMTGSTLVVDGGYLAT